MTRFNHERLNEMHKLSLSNQRERASRQKFKWTPIRFGRYEGLIIPEIVWRDISYFYWALSQDVFRGELEHQARIVAGRAAHILPPGGDDNFEFVIERNKRGKLMKIAILKKRTRSRARDRLVTRCRHLDLAIIDEFYASCRRDAAEKLLECLKLASARKAIRKRLRAVFRGRRQF